MDSVSKPSIIMAVSAYLDTVAQARSANTARTYHNGIRIFLETLTTRGMDTASVTVDLLPEDAIAWFAAALKDYSPATERLYLTAAAGFYEYLSAESLAAINLSRVRLLIRQRARRPGQRLPQFPKNDIDRVLEYAEKLAVTSSEDENERLRNLRDRAFLLTLADTGLRVHEACGLRRGDLDWNEGRALIIGKGDRQAIVRFSNRVLSALKSYLSARAQLDGKTRRPLTALPLFSRHDKGAGVKIKPITTATGRNIVNDHVEKALGPESVGQITPHSFRHYFVTRVLQASGNLKLAQELARHRNIAVTQRYAHLSDDELDKGYWNAIEGDREQ
jgi:integrase/recombinase XerC